MLKSLSTYLVFVIFIFIISNSCKKSVSGQNGSTKDTLLVSANFLIGMLTKDWQTVEPMLNSKPGYWYTEFSESQNEQISAAISLPVYDTTSGKQIRSSILLNVYRGTNEVTSVSLTTVDSLSQLNKEQSYALQKSYFYNGLLLQKDSTQTYPFYTDSTGFTPKISLNDWLNKLNEGYSTSLIGIEYDTKRLNLSIKSGTNPNSLINGFEFDGSGK